MIYDSHHTAAIAQAQTERHQLHTEQMLAIFQNLRELLAKKGTDYNGLQDWPSNMIFGDSSWATLIAIKTSRLTSLVYQKSNGKNESLEDTLLDLANYAVAYLAWRRMMNAEAEASLLEQEHKAVLQTLLRNSRVKEIKCTCNGDDCACGHVENFQSSLFADFSGSNAVKREKFEEAA